MLKWILILAALLLVVLVVVGAAGAVYYFYVYLPSQGVGPLPTEAMIFPSQSTVVGGVDVKQITSSTLYKKLASEESAKKGMQEIETKLGLRPERDIDWIAFATQQPAPGKNTGLVLIRGRFDLAKLKAAIEKEEKKTSTAGPGGVATYALDNDASLALLDKETLLFGSSGEMNAAINAYQQKSRPLAQNSELTTRLKAITGKPTLWVFAGSQAMATLQQAVGEQAESAGFKLPELKSTLLTLGLTPKLDLNFTFEAVDEAGASTLSGALNGLVAMLGMSAAKEPGLKELASSIKVTKTAKSVSLTAQASYEVIEKSIIAPMLQARVSANEAAAIGDIRTVISAEAAYQSANSGYYDKLECLGKPETCIPDYNGPYFLDATLASGEDKNGYRRTFHAGPAAPPTSGASPSSLSTYAYVAVPTEWEQTGARAFCGDASGVIWVTTKRRTPLVVNGECSQTGAEPLR
jgi:hypothetical protein